MNSDYVSVGNEPLFGTFELFCSIETFLHAMK